MDKAESSDEQSFHSASLVTGGAVAPASGLTSSARAGLWCRTPWEWISVSTDFQVRLATPDDEAAVDRLLAASYPRLSAGAYEAQAFARALPFMTKANRRLLASGSYFVAQVSAGPPRVRESAGFPSPPVGGVRKSCLVGAGGWTRERPGTAEVEDHLGHIRHF